MARFWGLVVFLFGVGGAFVLKYQYDHGEPIHDIWFVVTPMLILYGLASIVEPRVMQNRTDTQEPGRVVLLQFGAPLLGLIIGLYVRYVIFKDWHR